MIDPVSGVATAASQSHLKLVFGGSAIAVSQTPAKDAKAATDGSSATSGAARPAPTSATRVYIDRSASGVYVYQLVNVSNGRVLVELPRAESGSLDVLDGYAPGVATHVSA